MHAMRRSRCAPAVAVCARLQPGARPMAALGAAPRKDRTRAHQGATQGPLGLGGLGGLVASLTQKSRPSEPLAASRQARCARCLVADHLPPAAHMPICPGWPAASSHSRCLAPEPDAECTGEPGGRRRAEIR